MDLLAVDKATAATIRKVMHLHHVEVGPPKTKPALKCDQEMLSSATVPMSVEYDSARTTSVWKPSRHLLVALTVYCVNPSLG